MTDFFLFIYQSKAVYDVLQVGLTSDRYNPLFFNQLCTNDSSNLDIFLKSEGHSKKLKLSLYAIIYRLSCYSCKTFHMLLLHLLVLVAFLYLLYS